MPPPTPRPIDATLSVTKAARLLGVHPNTIRAWSDAGRLRYYRINPRGDRRYRLGDLQRFLAAAAEGPAMGVAAGFGHGHPARRLSEPVPIRGAHPPRLMTGLEVLPTPSEAIDRDRRQADFQLLTELATIAATAGRGHHDLDDVLVAAVEAIRHLCDYLLVAAVELRGDVLVPRAVAGPPTIRLADLPRSYGTLGLALAAPEPGVAIDPEPAVGVVSAEHPELAAVIASDSGPWGVLLVVTDEGAPPAERDADLAVAAARTIGAAIRGARAADDLHHQLHRAEALRRVASDIGSRLDLDQILGGLVDHAMVLFEGDRAAVFLRRPDGRAVAEVSRGLSAAYLNAVRDFPEKSLPSASIAARRPLFATNYRDDPRGAGVRAAVVQEGFDTLCTAPLLNGDEVLGLLNVYHDRPHLWTEDELETMGALAAQASVAIKTAQNYSQMATWAAQLQSIQQLGARLNRLTSVKEIGLAIATELRQLIDYHNVRVYRQYGPTT